MSSRDAVGLGLSYIYAFGMLLLVEALGRRLRWAPDVTRKLIHIGAGLWIWGILALFDHWQYGIIPFATFVPLNYLFYRRRLFKTMDTADATPGTVYFALSITILFVLFWRTGGSPDRVFIAAAATMAMTWGDALASIVGIRHGHHPYVTFAHQRSWEGTLTMLVTSVLVIYLTLRWLPASPLSPYSRSLALERIPLVALLSGLVATVAEALSPTGTDNLSVPLLTGLALFSLCPS